MKNKMLITIIITVIVGAGAFYAGTKYKQSKQSANFRQFNSNRTGFRPISGQIIESDDKSITVKLQDGSSKIVILSDKTTISKATAGAKSDLKNGENIAVFGQENADGSVTAQNIQLRSNNQ